jgi:hypothetical protein
MAVQPQTHGACAQERVWLRNLIAQNAAVVPNPLPSVVVSLPQCPLMERNPFRINQRKAGRH